MPEPPPSTRYCPIFVKPLQMPDKSAHLAFASLSKFERGTSFFDEPEHVRLPCGLSSPFPNVSPELIFQPFFRNPAVFLLKLLIYCASIVVGQVHLLGNSPKRQTVSTTRTREAENVTNLTAFSTYRTSQRNTHRCHARTSSQRPRHLHFKRAVTLQNTIGGGYEKTSVGTSGVGGGC